MFKLKGWTKMPTNANPKKAGLTIVIADKVDWIARSIKRDI